jgi:uncharacterized Fe-S center protein
MGLFTKRQPQNAFVQLDTHKCQACWQCVHACRKNVLGKIVVLWHKHAVIRKGEDCVGCFKCVEVCHPGALQRGVAP